MSKHMCPIQLLMLIYHLHLTRAWLGAAPRMNTPKHVFQRNWTPCSKYGNHSRLKSQLDSDGGKGDLYDHLMSMNTFILIIKWYSHELHKSQGKWLQPLLGTANHLLLITCFISYEKWTRWKKETFKTHLLTLPTTLAGRDNILFVALLACGMASNDIVCTLA